MASVASRRRGRATSRPKVLYVDDQVGNLTAFRASLRRHADVDTALSGEEGLEMLATCEYPVVISDQRMNGMTGSEFLSEVRRRSPDSVRILLTAYADFVAVVSAVNDGAISRFVQKPWDREEMKVILTHSAESFRNARATRELAGRITELDRLAMAARLAAPLLEDYRALCAGLASGPGADALSARLDALSPLLSGVDPKGVHALDAAVRASFEICAKGACELHLSGERGEVEAELPALQQLLHHVVDRAVAQCSDGVHVDIQRTGDQVALSVAPIRPLARQDGDAGHRFVIERLSASLGGSCRWESRDSGSGAFILSMAAAEVRAEVAA